MEDHNKQKVEEIKRNLQRRSERCRNRSRGTSKSSGRSKEEADRLLFKESSGLRIVAYLEYLSGLVLYHQGLDLLELLPLQLLLLFLKARESG